MALHFTAIAQPSRAAAAIRHHRTPPSRVRSARSGSTPSSSAASQRRRRLSRSSTQRTERRDEEEHQEDVEQRGAGHHHVHAVQRHQQAGRGAEQGGAEQPPCDPGDHQHGEDPDHRGGDPPPDRVVAEAPARPARSSTCPAAGARRTRRSSPSTGAPSTGFAPLSGTLPLHAVPGQRVRIGGVVHLVEDDVAGAVESHQPDDRGDRRYHAGGHPGPPPVFRRRWRQSSTDDLWHSGAGGLRCGLGQRHPVIVGCGYGCRSRWRGSMKGRVVLLGAPLGNPADASSRFRETLATADVVAAEDTRRLDAPGQGPGHHHRRHRGLLLRGQRGPTYARAGRRRASRIGGGAGDRRRHAQRLRPRLPPGDRGPGRRGAGDRGPGTERGHHRAGPVRTAVRPLLLRGLPTPPTRAAPGTAGRARRGRADAGVLRSAAPGRRDARGPGRRVRPAPAGGAVPGTHQDSRGDPARHARGAGPLGRRVAAAR